MQTAANGRGPGTARCPGFFMGGPPEVPAIAEMARSYEERFGAACKTVA